MAWRLCTTIKAGDVTDTPEDALVASGCEVATVAYKPRLLSNNGTSYIICDLAKWLDAEDWTTSEVHPTTHKPGARSLSGHFL